MKRNNRNIVFCILAASLLLCSTSCKKEKETEMVTLKLALEQPTDPSANQKVYLDDQKLVCWYGTSDESIRVNNSNTPIQVHNNTASVEESNTYTAVYPFQNSLGDVNSANNGSVTVTIPAVQTFERGADGRQNLKDLPMGACLTSATDANVPVLMFRNLASLIKVTVENPSATHPFRLNSIKLSSTNNVPLHGKYRWDFKNNGANVSTNNYSPTTFAADLTDNSTITYRSEIMLDLNGMANPSNPNDLSKYTFDTIGPDGSKTYYIVVAPITTACTLRVDVRGAVLGDNWEISESNVITGSFNGEAIKIRSKTFSNQTVTLDRSRFGTINVKLRTASGQYVESGGFSVDANATPTIRYFSPGNVAQDSKDKQLIFIHDQYGSFGSYQSYRGHENGNRQLLIDLFPYYIYNKGAATNITLDYHSIFTYYPNSLPYFEPAGTWDLLTQPQFDFILSNNRPVANSYNARYAKACIGGEHNGGILFPDGYVQPDGISINAPNTPTSTFSSNSLTHAQWKLMEAAGAIFLPTTGLVQLWFYYYVNQYTGATSLVAQGYQYYSNQDNTCGYYWIKNTNNWYNLWIEDNGSSYRFLRNTGNGIQSQFYGPENRYYNGILYNVSTLWWYFAIRPVRASN